MYLIILCNEMNVIRLVVRSHTRLVDSHQQKNCVDCSPPSETLIMVKTIRKLFVLLALTLTLC
jgi:hypothetical protein